MILRLTTVGRQTLADGANRATRAVTLTRLAAGDQFGPGGAADDARTTLRHQRATAAVTGSTALAGRLVARGDLMPTAAFSVTEVGLFAQVGTDPEILLAYWTSNGQVLAAATAGVTLVLAAVVEIQAASAEITVTLNPAVTIAGPETFLGLTDTPAAYVAGQPLLRVNAAGAAVELVAPTALQLNAAQLVAGRVPAARLGRKRYAVITTDVENTAAETNAFAFEVGANEMGDGDLLRLRWLAVHRNNIGRDRRYIYKVHWGNVSALVTSRASHDTEGSAEGSGTYHLNLWRRGATLYWSPAPFTVNFENGWDDEPVHSLTPAFDAAATVAFSVQLSVAHSEFYYRVYGVIAERLSPT